MNADVKLTMSEAALLAAFRGLPEKEKRSLLSYAQARAEHNKPARPALRLISGSKVTP